LHPASTRYRNNTTEPINNCSCYYFAGPKIAVLGGSAGGHLAIDDTVPIAQADLLAKKLKELGVPCEYEWLEGWPHTMDLSEEVNRRCLWRVEQFLAKYLPVPPGAIPRVTSRAADRSEVND
jgi:acetyl esterase/lipase